MARRVRRPPSQQAPLCGTRSRSAWSRAPCSIWICRRERERDLSAHAVGLAELSASAVPHGEPANDASAAPVIPAERHVAPRPESQDLADAPRMPELVNEQFASLASTAQLEGLPERSSDETTPRTGMRALTHVGPNATFDITLKLPKPAETLEGRRTRLTGRFKATVAAYKVLSALGLDATASKELVELFNAYEGRLRASVPEEQRKLELDALLPTSPRRSGGARAHRQSARRALARDDDMVTELDFRAKVCRR